MQCRLAPIFYHLFPKLEALGRVVGVGGQVGAYKEPTRG